MPRRYHLDEHPQRPHRLTREQCRLLRWIARRQPRPRINPDRAPLPVQYALALAHWRQCSGFRCTSAQVDRIKRRAMADAHALLVALRRAGAASGVDLGPG